jgi:hypothetical protein
MFIAHRRSIMFRGVLRVLAALLVMACSSAAWGQSYMMVADTSGKRVMLFSATDGTPLDPNFITPAATGSPAFGTIRGATQVGNEIWVCDQVSPSQIHRFTASVSPAPTYLGSIALGSVSATASITDMAVVNNQVFMLDINFNALRVYALDGTYVTTYPLTVSPAITCTYNVTAFGNQLLAQKTCISDNIYAFDSATGAYLSTFIAFGSEANGPMRQMSAGNSSSPSGSDVWIAAWKGIYHVPSTGASFVRYDATSDPNDGVNGVAILDNGEVMFTNAASGVPGYVGKINPLSASITRTVLYSGFPSFGGAGWVKRLQIGAPSPTNPYAYVTATPNPVNSDASVTITAAAVPGQYPASTGLGVTADLSGIGGSSMQALSETSPGSAVFTYTYSLALSTVTGSYNLPITVSDDQSRSSTVNLSLSVNGPTNPTVAPRVGVAIQGQSAVLQATVTPGIRPTSSGVSVSADLSSFTGGSGGQAFAETFPGSNIFSYTQAIAADQALGNYVIPVVVNDAEGRSAPATNMTIYVIDPAAGCGNFIDVESTTGVSNDTKSAATPVTLTSSTGGFSGFSLGSTSNGDASSNDTYLITRDTSGLTAGTIYQHTLTLTSAATAPTGSLRGLTQTAGAINSGTDGTVQGSTAATSKWYGFGNGASSFYYRISGAAASTVPYCVALTSTPVTPTTVATQFTPGAITIKRTSGTTPNMDFLVFDSSGNGVGDAASGVFTFQGMTTTSATVTRTLPAGTYYLATGIQTNATTGVVDNRAAPATSPTRTRVVPDSPNVVLNSSVTATSTSLPITISDASGNSAALTLTRNAAQQVLWVKFQVGAGVCCRGATCTTTVASQSDCVSFGTAGALWVTGGPACNTGGSTTTPCCYADFNKINGLSVQDIFDYLNSWFAGSLLSKTGGDGVTGTLAVQDIFDFLNAWFAGGC